MAMGIVNDSEFNDETNKLGINNINKVGIVKPIEKGSGIGRGIGNNSVPEGLRKIIGEESQINGRVSAIELSKQFGISESSVSAYNNGAHSTASYNEPTDVRQHINGAKERVSKRARNKLMLALSNMTPEKMTDTKIRDLAGVARDMSVIIKNMEPDTPKSPLEGHTGPAFVFYTPQPRKEDTFDVIYSKE